MVKRPPLLRRRDCKSLLLIQGRAAPWRSTLSPREGGRESVSEMRLAQVKARWRHRLPTPLLLATIFCLTLSGCEKELVTDYGRRSGPRASQSVNGLSVLSGMMENAGHKVTSTRWLSPSLHKNADVIVWAPDDMAPPSPEVRKWFDDWLWVTEGRTLIYIGRDYDAESVYWRAMLRGAPDDERDEIDSRLQRAERAQAHRRSRAIDKNDCDWFTTDASRPHRDVRKLDGAEEWFADIEPAKLDIELDTRLNPPAEADVLLASDDDVLVSRQEIGYGQLIIVANGSFLLNLPLVNHQHRKLAGKLVDELAPGSRVVFLETGADSPPIHDEDPQTHPRNGLEMFGVEPLNHIFLHLSILGVIFCFARLPIFGRALPPPAAPTSDFGQHVEAVGDLLAKTGDGSYAAARLLHYQQSRDGLHPARNE